MKVIQVLNDCVLSGANSNEINFLKNEFYIVSDDLCQKLKIVLSNVIGIEIPFKEIYNQYDGQDLNNRKILMIRHGGGGDILFMTTGISELKKKYPNSKISIAIGKSYFPLVKHNPNIEEVIELPISLKEWNKYHYHLMFENLIENNFQAKQLNAYDLFLERMKFDIKEISPENKIPQIFIKESEFFKALLHFPQLRSVDHSSRSVGIQVEASSPIRKYLPYNFIKVSKELVKKGYKIYLFGSEMQLPIIQYIASEIKENVFPVVSDLRTAIIVASKMKYFIAPDSMFIHIAGALRIPFIGIYGPFHSDLRMKYFQRSIGINAKTACSPCFLHGHHPCPKGEPSPCLKLITPEIILQTFEEMEKEN